MTVLDFLEHIYGLFGFKFELELSTRPENKLGDDAMWDQAEAAKCYKRCSRYAGQGPQPVYRF